MSTHVVVRNRIVAVGPGYDRHRKRKPEPLPTDRDGNPIVLGAPIPPGSHESVLPGPGIYDREDDCAYRVVDPHVPTPAGGYFPLRYLLERYRTEPEEVYYWVRKGWVDAVMSPPSPVKSYRVRNEAKIVEALSELYPRRKYHVRAPRGMM